ncbi:MAG: hypothetical protein AAF741_12295 [Bacteroidota bacterium]
MKLIGLLSILLFVLFLSSCSDDADRSRRLLIWTDVDLSNTDFTRLYADGAFVGEAVSYDLLPDCSVEDGLFVDLAPQSSVSLTVEDAAGSSRLLATLSLDDFSDGISVVTTMPDSAAVVRIDGTSDDGCTQVYLSW